MSGLSPATSPLAIPTGSWSRPKLAADRKTSPKTQPMCMSLRGLLLFLPAALAVAVLATDGAEARRYTSPALRHSVTGSIPHGPAPAAAVAVDPGPGPLKI